MQTYLIAFNMDDENTMVSVVADSRDAAMYGATVDFLNQCHDNGEMSEETAERLLNHATEGGITWVNMKANLDNVGIYATYPYMVE